MPAPQIVGPLAQKREDEGLEEGPLRAPQINRPSLAQRGEYPGWPHEEDGPRWPHDHEGSPG